jgi:hypothetical protein
VELIEPKAGLSGQPSQSEQMFPKTRHTRESAAPWEVRQAVLPEAEGRSTVTLLYILAACKQRRVHTVPEVATWAVACWTSVRL